MQRMNQAATRAYASSASHRTAREQEADVFRRAIGALRAAKSAGPVEQVRALADNRRLWTAIDNLMRDPANQLPQPLRASIISVGLAVRREMEQTFPDFEFLIGVNESIAAGLSGDA